IESVCVLNGSHDAIVYDLGHAALQNFYTGARLLRQANVWRSYQLAGTPFLAPPVPGKTDSITLAGPRGPEALSSTVLRGYDPLSDGVRVRWRWQFAAGAVEAEDTLRVRAAGHRRHLVRELRLTGLPARSALEVRMRVPGKGVEVAAS